MKSQEKRCLNRAYWNSKSKCWVVCMCSSLSQERRKKSHSLLSEDKNDHNTENQLPSHTYGAMERICILGAQEDKHRDGGESRQCPPAYRQLTCPTALCNTSGHVCASDTDHNLVCLSIICSTKSSQQPFCYGKPILQTFHYLLDEVESYEVIFALCIWNIERSGNGYEFLPIFLT